MQDLKFNCLLDNTKIILEQLIQFDFMRNFVLVGGSALALYLCHRKSEDLDFFTYENVEIKNIKNFLKNFKNKQIVNLSDVQIDVL